MRPAVLSRFGLPFFNLSSRPYTGGSLLLNPESDRVTPAVPLTEMILFLLLSNCLPSPGTIGILPLDCFVLVCYRL